MISWKEFDQLIRGEEVILLGPGPSLVNFDIHENYKQIIVALNAAIYRYKLSDILVTRDTDLYKEYKEEYIDKLVDTGCPFIGESCNNSGQYVFELLGFFGAKKIKAYGFDLMTSATHGHWNNLDAGLGYEHKQTIIDDCWKAIDKHGLEKRITWMS